MGFLLGLVAFEFFYAFFLFVNFNGALEVLVKEEGEGMESVVEVYFVLRGGVLL